MRVPINIASRPADNTRSLRMGVLAFGNTLMECETQLGSMLEDWVRVGLKLGHELPVIAT